MQSIMVIYISFFIYSFFTKLSQTCICYKYLLLLFFLFFLCFIKTGYMLFEFLIQILLHIGFIFTLTILHCHI